MGHKHTPRRIGRPDKRVPGKSWWLEEAMVSDGKHECGGVEGKVVDGITIFDDQDGFFEIDIRFQDKTGFHIRLDSRMVLEAAELRDWKEGEGTLVAKSV